MLSVYAQEEFKFQPVSASDEWHHVVLGGEWTEQSGGCPNPENRYWKRNPQWRLQVDAPTSVTVSIARRQDERSAESATAMGCILLDDSSMNKASLDSEDVVAHTGFVSLPHASVQMMLVPAAKPYTLIACTFEPGQKVCNLL